MKKILAHILIVAMLISSFAVPVTAAENDKASYITEAEYGFVNAMGSTYGYEYSRIVGSVLTRGQVCRVLTYFGNFRTHGLLKFCKFILCKQAAFAGRCYFAFLVCTQRQDVRISAEISCNAVNNRRIIHNYTVKFERLFYLICNFILVSSLGR